MLEQSVNQIDTTPDRPAHGFIDLLCLMSIVLFLTWPKYVIIPGFGVNPYSLLMMLLFPILFFKTSAIILRDSPRDFMKRVVFLSFLALSFSNVLSFAFGGVDASLIVFARNFFQIDALFFVGFYLGFCERLEHTLKVLSACFFLIVLIGFIEFSQGSLLADWILSNARDLVTADRTNLTNLRLRDGQLRVQSVLDHPIVYGGLCAAFLPLITMRFQGSVIVGAVSAISCVVGVYLSGSRGAIIALLGALLFLFFVRNLIAFLSRRPSGLLIFIFGLVAAAILFFESLVRLISGRSGPEELSNKLRSDMWFAAQSYVEEAPLFGWGDGSASSLVGVYLTDVPTVDDSYLTILIENGLVGLFLFFLFFTTVVFRLVANTSQSPSHGVRVSIAACIVAILIQQKITSIPFLFGIAFLFAGFSIGSTSLFNRMPYLSREVKLHQNFSRG